MRGFPYPASAPAWPEIDPQKATTDYTDCTDPEDSVGAAMASAITEVAFPWWMRLREVTADVIGAGMVVLNELKPGLDERLYENALVLELQSRGRGVEQQRGFNVEFRGRFIGRLVPDLIVDGAVIVDTTVVAAFTAAHVAQMLGYLNIAKLEVALLLNFKQATLQWTRVVR